MESKFIHIVSFDVPYPADYGGVIDIYYRIKAFKELGVKVILHCFEYGRLQPKELEELVEKVYYYERKKTLKDWSKKTPFIVESRNSEELLSNLMMDNYPILFEGIHCTYWLDNSKLKHRLKIVRAHNIEHHYYYALARKSKGLKKLYYLSEARKLRAYEKVLFEANFILAIKDSEREHFSQYCKTYTLPPAVKKLESQEGDFNFDCLYHGNLSVGENIEAIEWLVKKVFVPNEWNNRILVAGKNPNKNVVSLLEKYQIMLIANPDEEELLKLKRGAKIHLMYSGQATGVKLKLINVLMTNGAIIANHNILDGLNIPGCDVANTASEFSHKIENYFQGLLVDTKARHSYAMQHFDTIENTRLILELLNN